MSDKRFSDHDALEMVLRDDVRIRFQIEQGWERIADDVSDPELHEVLLSARRTAYASRVANTHTDAFTAAANDLLADKIAFASPSN